MVVGEESNGRESECTALAVKSTAVEEVLSADDIVGLKCAAGIVGIAGTAAAAAGMPVGPS